MINTTAPLIVDASNEFVKYLPIGAQVYQFTVVAEIISKATNPVVAVFSGLKLIGQSCLPPSVKYPLKCLLLIGQIGVGIYTGGAGTILSTTLAIGSARQILEEYLE